jgi:hypothetical protein
VRRELVRLGVVRSWTVELRAMPLQVAGWGMAQSGVMRARMVRPWAREWGLWVVMVQVVGQQVVHHPAALWMVWLRVGMVPLWAVPVTMTWLVKEPSLTARRSQLARWRDRSQPPAGIPGSR